MIKLENDIECNLDIDVVYTLRHLRYIGLFPGGQETLLVPLSNALDEAKVINPELTKVQLKNILKKHNVRIYNSLDEYVRENRKLKWRRDQ